MVNDKSRSYHDVEERMYLWLMIRPGLIMMWKKECTMVSDKNRSYHDVEERMYYG